MRLTTIWNVGATSSAEVWSHGNSGREPGLRLARPSPTPLEHQTGLNPTIEMGARPYQTPLGRFLAVDPIEGGTPNDYLYVSDPVNRADLDGRVDYGAVASYCNPWSKRINCARALMNGDTARSISEESFTSKQVTEGTPFGTSSGMP